ncbi:hypothetical protein ACO0LD_11535 [Undibacterium sp. Ji83W]|uniref:hypothetical protein n=1 Tax=Undibacterium sp. Ji83W TaxID=3413043 RepID=UPI003BEF9445
MSELIRHADDRDGNLFQGRILEQAGFYAAGNGIRVVFVGASHQQRLVKGMT